MIQERPFCFLDETDSSDAAVAEWASSHGFPCPPCVNAGMVYLARGTWDEIPWEQILPPSDRITRNHFTEQTAVACALQAAGFDFLPREEALLTMQGCGFPEDFPHPVSSYRPFAPSPIRFENLVCRHYINPVRHRMWPEVWPEVRRKMAVRS